MLWTLAFSTKSLRWIASMMLLVMTLAHRLGNSLSCMHQGTVSVLNLQPVVPAGYIVARSTARSPRDSFERQWSQFLCRWATYLRMVVNRQCLTSSVSQQPECQQCLTHCGSTGIDLGVASDITKTITQASCPSRAREQLRLQILSMQQAFTACESCRVPIIASVQGNYQPKV